MTRLPAPLGLALVPTFIRLAAAASTGRTQQNRPPPGSAARGPSCAGRLYGGEGCAAHSQRGHRPGDSLLAC